MADDVTTTLSDDDIETTWTDQPHTMQGDDDATDSADGADGDDDASDADDDASDSDADATDS